MSVSDQTSKLTFEQAAVRSGLISQKKYNKVVELVGTQDENVVAATLVKSGVITEYQAHQIHAGRTKFNLGAYVITDVIGQGGMGQVFKAVHKVLGRECAVKVLPLSMVEKTPDARVSFIREMRLQAGLDCPYLVRAFDAGQDGKVLYLVTEYVPGRDLRKLIKSNGPLSMADAALITSQAALGLQYAHDMGLVHRDVKPGNILVTPEGHAKITDIGLATWSMSIDDDPRAGKIVGTADYLSPEQVRDPKSVGPLSDVYSLGCTLYYEVTGKVPFPGGDSKSKCRKHCEQTPWHPRKFAPDLSEEFVDVIADMMEKDPSRRIPSAAEVAERLEPWASTATEVIDLPIDRQAWTPPPPPQEPSQIEPPQNRETTDSAGSGTAVGSGGLSASNHADSTVIPPLPGEWEPEPAYDRPNHAMPIAIALAVAIPLSLLVGAIVGFVVRGQL